MSDRLPHFVIAGAPKAGTIALHAALGESFADGKGDAGRGDFRPRRAQEGVPSREQ